MVQLNLPANSKVEKGQYYKDKTGSKNIRKINIYRWDPSTNENPRLDTYEVDMDNLLTGVKSSHDKYYDKMYDSTNKRLPINTKYIKNIRDNITKCPSDYTKQIKNILKNNNLIAQYPGYTKDEILHELRYINNLTLIEDNKYKTTVPFPVSPDFFK